MVDEPAGPAHQDSPTPPPQVHSRDVSGEAYWEDLGWNAAHMGAQE